MVLACPVVAALSTVTSPTLLPQKTELGSLLAWVGEVETPAAGRPTLSAREAPGMTRQS